MTYMPINVDNNLKMKFAGIDIYMDENKILIN